MTDHAAGIISINENLLIFVTILCQIKCASFSTTLKAVLHDFYEDDEPKVNNFDQSKKTLVFLLQMKVLFFQLFNVKTFATLFSLMTIEYKRHVIKAHVSNIK